MTSRPRTALAALTVAFLALGACGSDAATDDATTDATDAATDGATDTTEAATDSGTEGGGPFRIAIVAPSASNDLAFTQSIVDGVEALDVETEVDITDSSFVVEDAAAAIRAYAEDDYDLVIAHGSQYGGSLAEIAPEFPEVSFAWGTAADTFGLDNVWAYEAASDEGGYVMGAMAAQITESGTVGIIGPVEVGDAKLYVDGFRNGAESGGAEVLVNYTESFSDVALAAEAATTQIGAGADVLSGTAQMVVGATGVASEAGVPWFGTQANQTALGEDIVVASQVYHWEVVLADIISQINEGVLGGEVYTLTLENGGLVVEFNDAFDLPEEVRAAGDEAVEAISSGELETGA